MVYKLFNFKLNSTPFSVLRGIACVSLLFYIVSCSDSSTSSSFSLATIKPLTLSGVDESSITIDWKLLKTRGGTIDYTIVYTVYVETNDGGDGKVFTKDPSTETKYTLTSINPGDSSILPVDNTGGKTDGIKFSGLSKDTPYRIVVEARDASGNTSRSRLLAYTASELINTDMTGIEVITTNDSKEVTVVWDPKKDAQSYLIQIIEGENLFGGDVLIDTVLAVVCPPGSVSCERKDQFAEQLENGKLKYVLKVGKRAGRYKLVVVPFNFQNLEGFRAVDEKGRVRAFTEEVLSLVKDKNSDLSRLLEENLRDSSKAKEVQVKMSEAKAPTDLVLDSTGDTLLASWGHGEGAEYYYAILTSEGVEAVTNVIDRYDPSGKFIGGGYTGFSDLTANTRYTVTVQSLTVSEESNIAVTNIGGKVSATLSTKDAENILDAPKKVAGEDLSLTNRGAGKLKITWSTTEVDSVVGYNVFYWAGDTAPNKPKYVAKQGETNITLTVEPNAYNVRVDVISTYPGREVVAGDVSSIKVYGNPLPPADLGVVVSRVRFIDISNKLYTTGYPLTYTKADTPLEAGGPVEDVSYHYRYRAEGGEWVGYNKIADENEAIVSLQVDDLSDPTVVKAGYGKKYQVGLVASNDGGFVSSVETLAFIYKSFPEPFIQKGNVKVETGDKSLTATWPEVSEVNGSAVSSYTVMLNEDPYELPVQSITIVERRVVFKDVVVNNRPYFITVIPNSVITGNIFTALSAVVPGYTINNAIRQGSQEERILTNYIGVPESYTPQGAPEAVVNLEIVADDLVSDVDDNQATVIWEESSIGSRATGYVLEYLADVKTPITHIETVSDAADIELSSLSWRGAVSIKVTINSSGNYSQVVNDLNISTATNVFRVRGIRIDDSKKEWLGEYRYYALGTDRSRAPSSVKELTFSDHYDGSFKVSWIKPEIPGRDREKVDAQLTGYRVSWGITPEELGNSFEIDNPETLSYIVSNLIQGSLYYVKVQAKNDNPIGNIYNNGLTETIYAIKRPEVVDSSIVYSGHVTNRFTVDWNEVTDAGYDSEGPLTSVGYIIELSSDQGGSWTRIDRSDYLSTTQVLSNLTPGTGYQVRIAATNEIALIGSFTAGEETWSLSLPDLVRDVVVSEPSYDEKSHTGGFKVNWAIPSDTGLTSVGAAAVVTGYEVAYAEVVGGVAGEYTSVTHAGTVTEHVFAGLKTNAQYRIRIQAKSAAGTGAGNYIDGWTSSLPKVVNSDSFAFFRPTASTIRVTWGVPEPGRAGGASLTNDATRYKVEIAPEGGQYTLVKDDYGSNTIIANNVDKLTSYRFRLTAKNDSGEADASISPSSGTPASEVRSLNVDSFTDIQVALSWQIPNDPGTVDGTIPATLSGYIVKYKQTDTDSEFIEIDENSEGVRLSGPLTGLATTVIGLSSSTSYTFLVVAVNSANVIGIEPDALKKEQTTTPSTPENLRDATCVKTDNVDLAWDASFGADYYELYRVDAQGNTNIITHNTTSYTDTGLTPGKSYNYKIRACITDVGCSEYSAPLKITALVDNHFKNIIASGEIPHNLADYDQRSREIFSVYKAGASIDVKYFKPDGPSGNGDGSSFDNALGPNSVSVRILDTGPNENEIYVRLLAGGKYTPPQQALSLRDYVAIIGGVDECLGSSVTPTVLSGEKFKNKTSSTSSVFSHNLGSANANYSSDNPMLTNTALLYGVTVTSGEARNGGGMYNIYASPTLIKVTFSGNHARNDGGGMYNIASSPVLIGVTFSGNTAEDGGGMYNASSFPNLIGVTFFDNRASGLGGGIYNNNSGHTPLIINGVFWGNNASTGQQFYIDNDTFNDQTIQENLHIYNSIVEGGTGTLVSGTSYTDPFTQGGFVSGGGTSPVVISFANIIANNPVLGDLANNDDLLSTHAILTHAIQSGSPAENQGLYVKKSGTTFYYSADSTAWYTEPDLSGTAATVPADALDLTATDATGYTRTDRPDLGAYEAR